MSNILHTYTSYQLANGKWVPKVTEREYLPNEVKERFYTWEELFDSKKEADEFAKTKVDANEAATH